MSTGDSARRVFLATTVRMDILKYFTDAHRSGLRPALVEFEQAHTKRPISACGIKPRITLAVKDGVLFRDGKSIGTALDIFDHLHAPTGGGFFPAWIGYFSYEFARFFGKACQSHNRLFPDAFFQYFEEGIETTATSPNSLCTLTTHGAHDFRASMSRQQFFDVVRNIKNQIRNGDVYQVNFSMPFNFDATDNDMIALYAAMRHNNPSPFMGIMHDDDWWLLSGSPERLFSLHEGRISARPIAGTKSRKSSREAEQEQINLLRTCPKENAEHAMLVDLMRNDLNQVAEPGSVVVDEDRSVEFYSHVMHLVSELCGRTDAPLQNIFAAMFPGGTITGAPKSTVMKTIAELEPIARGPYTGSFGYVSSGYGTDFNILIRSIYGFKGHARVNAGAGIVIDSDEESEWVEIARKAQAIKDILANKRAPKPPRPMIKGKAIATRKPHVLLHDDKRVLFIENLDSFSFNIVDALRGLGAAVDVRAPNDKIDLGLYSHAVVGPGPGNPENLPSLVAIISSIITNGIPLLGICLGHQAIGHFFGARIKGLQEPVHGKPHTVYHHQQGLFLGLTSPTTFTRYHSLVIEQAPANFAVDAFTADDSIMAIRNLTQPIFGVQFHPESYLSEDGHKLLANFLMVNG